MEVLSLVKLTKGRAKICLAGGADFVLYKKEYENYGIEEGAELSEADYQQILTDIVIPRCKKRALHLLEKQDRSEKNLRDKLKEGGYSEDVIDIAIDYINSYGYLDDARMAASHVRFYQDSRSRMRIKQDLLGKGISSDVIERVLEEEYTADEGDLIESLLVKKHYDKENATYEERAKMYRFLASRGFSSDSINRVLK
jgi:regulatory protein